MSIYLSRSNYAIRLGDPKFISFSSIKTTVPIMQHDFYKHQSDVTNPVKEDCGYFNLYFSGFSISCYLNYCKYKNKDREYLSSFTAERKRCPS